MGRPRVRGDKLPSPEQRAADPNAWWTPLQLDIHGRPATVQILAFDALWYTVAHRKLVRFVVIRDWPGHAKDDVLVCTDTTRDARWIISAYCLRWSIEVTFFWGKGRLGLQDAQNRTEAAVLRTAPMALWTYSLIVYWYLTGGDSNAGAALPRLPWYASKKTPALLSPPVRYQYTMRE